MYEGLPYYKHSNHDSLLGYAIIQLPDVMLFIYGYVKEKLTTGLASRSNKIHVVEEDGHGKASGTKADNDITSITEQNNLETRVECISERLSKLEEINVTLIQKIDEITKIFRRVT